VSTDDAFEEPEWWNSLTDAEREAHAVLTDEQKAELDRRWAEHLADPDSAISWEELKRRLRDRRAP
jgi:putative addiction module component (TIGR02574 family)